MPVSLPCPPLPVPPALARAATDACAVCVTSADAHTAGKSRVARSGSASSGPFLRFPSGSDSVVFVEALPFAVSVTAAAPAARADSLEPAGGHAGQHFLPPPGVSQRSLGVALSCQVGRRKGQLHLLVDQLIAEFVVPRFHRRAGQGISHPIGAHHQERVRLAPLVAAAARVYSRVARRGRRTGCRGRADRRSRPGRA